ncbi:hypothetical protein NMY22_g15547 [Coprinellus aureogranulatus]|nr:hypothetical protein NMY22_g15547 [Coprinellus aureogranulatus]
MHPGAPVNSLGSVSGQSQPTQLQHSLPEEGKTSLWWRKEDEGTEERTRRRAYTNLNITSQSTVERSIGEVGRKITSKKEPFAHLANIIVEQEIVRVVSLYYPEIIYKKAIRKEKAQSDMRQKIRLSKVDQVSEELTDHLFVVFRDVFESGKRKVWQSGPEDEFFDECDIVRFGKRKLTNGMVLRSEISEIHSARRSAQDLRDYRWFEAASESTLPNSSHKQIFGEVQVFYTITNNDNESVEVAIYKPLIDVCEPLKTAIRGRWPANTSDARAKLAAIEVKHIHSLVGIFEGPDTGNIYIQRKHPGLLLLTPLERGIQEDVEREDMDDTEIIGW